jgi:hypothetical protein
VASAGEPLEEIGENGVPALGAGRIPGLCQFGKAVGLGDDDAAHLDQMWLQDGGDVLAGELAQGGGDIVAVG